MAKTSEERRAAARARYYANKERILDERKVYYLANREVVKARTKKWKSEHLDKVNGYAREARLRRVEHDRAYRQGRAETQAKYHRAWREQNRGRLNAYQRERQMLRLRACPPWARGDSRIRALYEIARWLCLRGDLVEIDHLYPLKPKDMNDACGLHVYANLRIVEREVNRRKQNRQPTQHELDERRGL